MYLPREEFLPGLNVSVPYYMIGDGGFPLKDYLMKPFMRLNNPTVPPRIFNYRLSHARRVIECAFGELSQVWQVNQTALPWNINTSEKVVMSTVCLHNFLIDVRDNDNEGRWNRGNENEINHDGRNQNMNNYEAHRIRQRLSEYFVSPEGSVAWQWERI